MTLRQGKFHSLQGFQALCPGTGDDTALSSLVSSQDVVRRCQQFRLGQQGSGLLIAAACEGRMLYFWHVYSFNHALAPGAKGFH